MTEAWAYAGSAVLAAATVPQTVRLLRTRSVDDFGWWFILLNAVGIALLLVRAAEIREPAFIIVNAIGVAFWTFAAALKLLARPKGNP